MHHSHQGTRLHLSIGWNPVVFDLIGKGLLDELASAAGGSISFSFFGAVSGLFWNGGRLQSEIGGISLGSFISHILYLNSLRTGFRFTFNTTVVEQADFDNKTLRLLLQSCDNPLNGVIVAHEQIAAFIRDNWPRYELIASTILTSRHIDTFLNLYKFYDIAVLPEDLALDRAFLASMPHAEQAEIILNSRCAFRCPHRMAHYEHIHKENRRHPKESQTPFELPCPKDVPDFGFPLTIHPDDVGAYRALGIRHFKFLERASDKPNLDLLFKYIGALTSA